MRGDLLAISLPHPSSGKFRFFAFDFPEGKGIVRAGQAHYAAQRPGRRTREASAYWLLAVTGAIMFVAPFLLKPNDPRKSGKVAMH